MTKLVGQLFEHLAVALGGIPTQASAHNEAASAASQRQRWRAS